MALRFSTSPPVASRGTTPIVPRPVKPPPVRPVRSQGGDTVKFSSLSPALEQIKVGEALLGYKGPNSQALPYYNGPRDKGTSINTWPVYALTSPDHPIQTSGMYACLALMIAGPKKSILPRQPDMQYMMHFTQLENPNYLYDHLTSIPLDLRKSQIYLLPGSHQNTERRIRQVMRVLDDIDPALPSQVQFVHYPDEAAEYAEQSCWEGRPLTVAETVSVVMYQGKPYWMPLKFKPGGQSIHPELTPINS